MARSVPLLVVSSVCVLSISARAASADDVPPPTTPAPSADGPAATAPAPSTETAPATTPTASTADQDIDKPAVVTTAQGASFEDVLVVSRSRRDVAEEFLVLPEGIDVGAQLRSVNASGVLGMSSVKLTDVALFDAQAQWAIARHFELDANVSILAKQPSSTSEGVFQGGGLTLRRDLVRRTALALGASEAPLLGVDGQAFGSSLFVNHKHRLNEIVTFELTGGADALLLRPTSGMTSGMDKPWLVEAAAHASVLARVPDCNCYGAWLGVGYALPVAHRGHDPITTMPLDPQPRLNVDIGNSVQLAKSWDFWIDLAILDRGDKTNPATQLPILDGGFDQIQVVVGLSRRLGLHDNDRGNIHDPLMLL